MAIRSYVLAALLIFTFGSTSRGRAQATGAITGLVTDASGAAVPGVTIEATNVTTAQTRMTVTANDGVYTIPLLNPSVYQVKVSLAGFRTTVRGGFEVL